MNKNLGRIVVSTDAHLRSLMRLIEPIKPADLRRITYANYLQSLGMVPWVGLEPTRPLNGNLRILSPVNESCNIPESKNNSKFQYLTGSHSGRTNCSRMSTKALCGPISTHHENNSRTTSKEGHHGAHND